MFLLTQLGSGLTALFFSIIIFFSDRRVLAYLVMLGTLSLWLVVELFKWITNRNRPYILVENARVIGNPPIGRSFPSGHTSQSFFLATLFAQHFDTGLQLTLFLYLLAFTVAITRMYIGAHYPRDVLAGSILGSLWGVFIGVIGGYM